MKPGGIQLSNPVPDGASILSPAVKANVSIDNLLFAKQSGRSINRISSSFASNSHKETVETLKGAIHRRPRVSTPAKKRNELGSVIDRRDFRHGHDSETLLPTGRMSFHDAICNSKAD